MDDTLLNPPEDVIEMILNHVPEAEFLTFDDALTVAIERDWEAATDFMLSVRDWLTARGIYA